MCGLLPGPLPADAGFYDAPAATSAFIASGGYQGGACWGHLGCLGDGFAEPYKMRGPER